MEEEEEPEPEPEPEMGQEVNGNGIPEYQSQQVGSGNWQLYLVLARLSILQNGLEFPPFLKI